jgi:class 3 adenylate cyclase/tetratricopeptide (TPR) repeat protein
LRCPACGHENRDAASFCDGCGSALVLTCSSCGAELRPAARFCDSCGAQRTDTLQARTPTPQPAPAPAPALPASFAAGRYQVQRFLGEGGKKRVYLARDTRLDRDVAVAVIKTEGLDEAGLKRVQREAQAMGRLGDHTNIVTVHDIGDDNGQPYIVSQHMGGGDLERLLAHSEEHRLSIARAIEIAEQVCAALEHAHSHAVIHRDLKPGNIWLGGDGSAKLGDFGLAVAIDRSRLTREGMMVGTTSYMPPEQAVGGEVTPKSDLYSLGCALYEMVTGRPPFLGDDSVAVISQHINTAPVAPSWHNPAVPTALDLLITQLLKKAPAERPQDARAVADELRRIRERSTVESVIEAPSPAANLRGLAWGQFVGRRQEMDQLKSALESALSGHGNLAMLAGEPGIGKTRLAEEFAVYASLRGAQVLTGRCFEGEVTLPYRPFIEAFRQYVRSRPDAELRGELGDGAPEVAKLVSEVHQRFPDIPQAQPLEAEAERLRLYESVSTFIRNASTANPIVLFLDDIHWADKPSLLLMRYLARAIAGQRVLLLGAYRDVELDRTHPLSEVMATLRRETPYQRVLLRGLAEEDVLGLIETEDTSEELSAGRRALAAALYKETEGNPFFIREVLSLLVEEGKLVHENGHWVARVSSVSELGIPEGVREVVGKRLSRVSEGCNRMLTLASTMTGGFTWEELKAIADVGEAELVELVEEALATQLIQERKGEQVGTYDFTHALIRQTLYGELSTPRRVMLHRQIGNALEAFYGSNVEPHLSELAHHFYQAAPGGDVDKAIDYATRAGDRAVEQLAHEEAAEHYSLALQALDLTDASDDRQRYDLLMALGQAYYRSDLSEKAMATLEQAVQLGVALGDAQLQGEAAVAYDLAVQRGPLAFSPVAVPVLERALEACGSEPSGLRARLLAALSLSLATPGHLEAEREQRLAIAREAKTVAELAGDGIARVNALRALHRAVEGPEWVEERLPVSRELIAVAEASDARTDALSGHLFLIGDLAQLGEMDEVKNEIALTCSLADQMREPTYSGWRPLWDAMLLTREGRFEEAERRVIEVGPIAQRTQHPGWIATFSAQFFTIRWAQGRLGELEQIVLQRLEEMPGLRAWQVALVILYLDTERPDQAREWFERLAAEDFADIPRDDTWIVTITLAANAAHRLGDTRRAAQLYEILEPYAQRQVTVGFAFICQGSASLMLGEAAATMGRWDDAERHFQEALAFNERTRTPPWLAATQFAYAGMLRARGGPGDDEKPVSLVNWALATFEELGMAKYVERALALKMELQGVPSSDFKTSIDAVASAVQHERPDLRPHAAPDGTVTLLFSDIEGSTALNERLGDQRWMALLREHNALVREQIHAHQGFEVKTEGDGFMVAFSSARRALQCAIAIQRAFAERNASAEEQVPVRIGLHTGEAIKEGSDFFGKHVNLAARIAGQARGGEVLVSSLLRELTASGGDIAFGAARDVELKGLTGTQRVFAVDWHLTTA